MKKKQEAKCSMVSDDAFYGSATMGERGQVVIPAEARAAMGFNPGDKLLIMRHPVHKGLMILKIEAVREFLDEFYNQLEKVERNVQAHMEAEGK